MEKTKKRTDLLAAGKKKLQQYRQRKDTKSCSTGSDSHGKLSHKTSKQDRGSDAKQEHFDLSNQAVVDRNIDASSDNSLVSQPVENLSEGATLPSVHNEAEFVVSVVTPGEIIESRTVEGAEAECVGDSSVNRGGEGEAMAITEVEMAPVNSSIPLSQGETILTVDSEVALGDSSVQSSEGKAMMMIDNEVTPADSSVQSSEGEVVMTAVGPGRNKTQ